MPLFHDSLWWDIWWPWMLLWLATAASLVAAVALLIGARRRRRRPSERLMVDWTCIYLDNTTIMDNFQLNRYSVSLRKEVQLRTTRSRALGLTLQFIPFLGPDASIETSRDVVVKYIEKAEPISAIGVIVDGLERSDAIVHADLRQGTVRRNAALKKALAGRPRSETAPLSRTERMFVLLTGSFRKDSGDRTDGRTVFVADYASAPGVRVRMSCLSTGLRGDKEAPGSFPGLCLGKVQSWEEAEGVLEVRPLAIFS
ncbi:hypothetical protein ACFZCY_21960 [Streptomyces sp. NPDC007983]|uniref:hypothetical protein n=1 Tax=Streptomyces sp. NPDC007983 TaxID=3364800 RepID=UPI0036E572E7